MNETTAIPLSKGDWRKNLRALGEENGFYEVQLIRTRAL